MGSDVAAYLDLGWKLIVVLALAVLALRGLRWLSTPALPSDGDLKVVSRLPIGPQHTLLLVSVSGRRLLVGQSPTAITLLGELGDEPRDSHDRPHSLTTQRDGSASPSLLPSLGVAAAIERGLARLDFGSRKRENDSNPLPEGKGKGPPDRRGERSEAGN